MHASALPARCQPQTRKRTSTSAPSGRSSGPLGLTRNAAPLVDVDGGTRIEVILAPRHAGVTDVGALARINAATPGINVNVARPARSVAVVIVDVRGEP